MNKFFYFLMVGFAFTGLQAATAAADDMECVNAGTPSQVADCWKSKAQSGSMKHEQNQHDGAPATMGNADHHPAGATGHHPPTATQGFAGDTHSTAPGHHPAGAPGMQGEHHDGPPGTIGGSGHHPAGAPGMQGEHHDGPPGTMGGPQDNHSTAAQGFSGEHDAPKGHHPEGAHHDGPPIDPRSGQAFTKADEVKYQKYADECEATRGLLSEGSTQELVKEGFTRLQVEKLCKDGPQHAPAPGSAAAGGMR